MNQDLSMVRGTTFSFVLRLKDSLGEELSLQAGDKLIFGIKLFPEHKNYIFSQEKILSDYDSEIKGYIFELTSINTISLNFGEYFYDIGLQMSNGDFYNVVECSSFFIKKNITKKE